MEKSLPAVKESRNTNSSGQLTSHNTSHKRAPHTSAPIQRLRIVASRGARRFPNSSASRFRGTFLFPCATLSPGWVYLTPRVSRRSLARRQHSSSPRTSSLSTTVSADRELNHPPLHATRRECRERWTLLQGAWTREDQSMCFRRREKPGAGGPPPCWRACERGGAEIEATVEVCRTGGRCSTRTASADRIRRCQTSGDRVTGV